MHLLGKLSGCAIGLALMVATPASGAEMPRGSEDTQISQRIYIRGGFGTGPYVRRHYYRPHQRHFYYQPHTYRYWGPQYRYYQPRHYRGYRRGAGVQFRVGF